MHAYSDITVTPCLVSPTGVSQGCTSGTRMPFHSLRYALSGLSLIFCMWGAEIPPTVDAGPPSAGFRTFTACTVESSASISERVYSWITPLSGPYKPTPGKPILPASEVGMLKYSFTYLYIVF